MTPSSKDQSTTTAGRILLIHDDPKLAGWLESRLAEQGYDICPPVTNNQHVLREISAHMPDVLIIDAQSENHVLLDCLAVVSYHQPMPMLMYSGQQAASYIDKAVASGVSSYLIDKLDPAKLPPMLEFALANFQHRQLLQQALERARSELTARSNVDKAKLHIMQRLKLDEAQAYTTSIVNASVR